MTASRVLVTGATGFVGSAVASQCQAAGWTVRTTGRAAVPPVPLPDYFQADLTSSEASATLLRGVGLVVHAAGVAHQFGKASGNVELFRRGNVEATRTMVQAAARAGVRHFVLISSASVYGDRPQGVYDESAPCRPTGPYAESKVQAEKCAEQIAAQAGMPMTMLRLTTVYGEGDPGNVARLMRVIDRGRFVWIGSGRNKKSLIHRDDVARACVAVLNGTAAGVRAYNIAAPPCAMRDVVEGLAKALGRRMPRIRLPAAPVLMLTKMIAVLGSRRGRLARLHTTVQKWLADDVFDGSAFCRDFDFQPVIDLADGLRREVAWYRGL
jgi:nucleoside-diphosphate-sugar epimerase